MKWITRATVLFAVLTLSAIAAWAQTAQCTEDYLNETYTKWYEPYKARDTSQQQKDLAYQIAKEYVNKCPNEFADNAYAKALKSYVQVYEKATATGKVGKEFTEAITKPSPNYKDIFRTGTAYVAVDQNNSTAYLWIGLSGLNEPSLMNDAVPAAKKAIELVEAGKSFEPYKSKELALAGMNELLGRAVLKTAPADAIPYFIKAAKYDSKNWQIYAELAGAYAGPRAKLTAEYKAKQTPEGNETPESKLVLLNLNEVIDRQIDSTARAAALATDAAVKKALMESLTDDYKFRKGSEAGLTDYVAQILSKPLPEPPTPITQLPTPTPTPTPGTSAATAGSAPSTTAAPSTAKPASAGSRTTGSASGTTTVGAKPAASPTPKPRSRQRNHRG